MANMREITIQCRAFYCIGKGRPKKWHFILFNFKDIIIIGKGRTKRRISLMKAI